MHSVSRSFCILGIVALSFVAISCTHVQLQQNTDDLTRTVPQLLDDQIVDNFFILNANQYALPAFQLVNSGTAQLTDQFGGQVGAMFPSPGQPRRSPLQLTAGQRQSNVGWTLQPITDPETLSHLRDIYAYVLQKPYQEYHPSNPHDTSDIPNNWKSRHSKMEHGAASTG